VSNFTENVMVMKSGIRLIPNYAYNLVTIVTLFRKSRCWHTGSKEITYNSFRCELTYNILVLQLLCGCNATSCL